MKKYFFSGLLILLPLCITLAIMNFLVNLLTTPFMKVFSATLMFLGLSDKTYLVVTSQLIILVLLFVTTIAIGALARWLFVKKMAEFGESLILNIPLVNKIYKASQDIIHTLFGQKASSFQQVVLVPFPTTTSYSVGLLVREDSSMCRRYLQRDMLSIFVPTTPNPTTGFILLFDRKDVIYTDLSVEEGLKYVVSCGMITPNIPSS